MYLTVLYKTHYTVYLTIYIYTIYIPYSTLQDTLFRNNMKDMHCQQFKVNIQLMPVVSIRTNIPLNSMLFVSAIISRIMIT